MNWIKLDIRTTHEASEIITDRLSAIGADGVEVLDREEIRAVLADPDSLSYADDGYVDSLDETVQIHAYFARFDQGVRINETPDFASPELYDDQPRIYVPIESLMETIRREISQIGEFLPVGEGLCGWRTVAEEDWANGWKQYYETIHLTERLVINPSWIAYEPSAGEIVVSLDPGSAFGTGTHETTAQCAELLDTVVQPGMNVLDLGCGSGILAILADKLGASPVEAIDIDALAVQVALENCRINESPVLCHEGELKDSLNSPYDLIIANIIADVIIQLLPDLGAHLKPGGRLIVSGIINTKADRVLKRAEELGFRCLEARSRNDWHAYLLDRG